jgi:hypothetical protein
MTSQNKEEGPPTKKVVFFSRLRAPKRFTVQGFFFK